MWVAAAQGDRISTPVPALKMKVVVDGMSTQSLMLYFFLM